MMLELLNLEAFFLDVVLLDFSNLGLDFVSK